MEYVREIVSSDTLMPLFNLPTSLQNRKVEVIISLADKETSKAPRSKSLRGCLSKYANPELSHMEKGAWAESVREKYANS